MPRYRVKDRTEEFDCPTCGAAVYAGDTAFQDGHDGDCYCSAFCAGGDPRGALAGILARVRATPENAGTLHTHTTHGD